MKILENFLSLVRFVLPMEIGITRMSSKGQVVIPKKMRKGIKVGETFVVIKNKGQLILKKTKDTKLLEDLEFARRTEKAYQQFKQGKFRKVSLEELEKW